jgi:hypothetical protein
LHASLKHLEVEFRGSEKSVILLRFSGSGIFFRSAIFHF